MQDGFGDFLHVGRQLAVRRGQLLFSGYGAVERKKQERGAVFPEREARALHISAPERREVTEFQLAFIFPGLSLFLSFGL